MAKKTENLTLPIEINTPNKDMVVSFIYTWARQKEMSVHEQRVILRIMEFASAKLDGSMIKDHLHKIDLGLWDVTLTMPTSDVISSKMNYEEIKAALDTLTDRSFTYEDDERWFKCHFIEGPEIKKHTGLMSFKVDNKLWKVFTDFSKGFRRFELNKALSLQTSYALQIYMLITGQNRPFHLTIDQLKLWLGIDKDKYKDKDGRDRINNLCMRVLDPSQKSLDESCPYTFTYEKIRVNPKNSKSPVTGFMLYPKYQPQFRDPYLEGKDLTQKVSLSWDLTPQVVDYLKTSIGFTTTEIKSHRETLKAAQALLPDFLGLLAELKGKSREKENYKGWIIGSIKGKLNDLKTKGQ
jgi:hypothetical protein